MTTLNPIQKENARPGTLEWILQNPVSCNEPDWLQTVDCTAGTPPQVRRSSIEGYAKQLTVKKGNAVEFCVSSRFRWFSVAIYRMGWYNSDGARRMPDLLLDPQTRELKTLFPGEYQPTPEPVDCPQDCSPTHCPCPPRPLSNFVKCEWKPSCRLEIPADPEDWLSGVYLAKLSGFNDTETPTENYMIFVVRDDDRHSDFLAQLSTTTWHAYNRWGGFSAYCVQPENPSPSWKAVWAQRLSFDRPFQSPDYYSGRFGSGAGLFLNNFTSKCSDHSPQVGFGNGRFGGWEYSMIRWLEREGYDLTYCTNTDIHDRSEPFKGCRCFLSLGHDEYWSVEMFDRVRAAVGKGDLSAGFFSGNTMYRRISLQKEDGEIDSRTMVSAECACKANEWTDLSSTRDTRLLIGTTAWKSSSDRNQDLTLILPPDLPGWFLEGTPLREWNQASLYSTLGLLLGGHEVNIEHPKSILPHMTPMIGVLIPDDSEHWQVVGVWQEPKAGPLTGASGKLFSAGTVMWGWALDDFAVPGHEYAVSNPPRNCYLSSDVQAITRNVLARLLQLSPPLPT